MPKTNKKKATYKKYAIISLFITSTAKVIGIRITTKIDAINRTVSLVLLVLATNCSIKISFIINLLTHFKI